jgi:hypothetical protein
MIIHFFLIIDNQKLSEKFTINDGRIFRVDDDK